MEFANSLGSALGLGVVLENAENDFDRDPDTDPDPEVKPLVGEACKTTGPPSGGAS